MKIDSSRDKDSEKEKATPTWIYIPDEVIELSKTMTSDEFKALIIKHRDEQLSGQR